MSQDLHKTPSLIVPLVASFVFHFSVLGFTMTVPMFKGTAYIETYSITLTADPAPTEEEVRVKRVKKKARTERMSLVKRVTRRKAALAERPEVEARQKPKIEARKEDLHWPQKSDPPKTIARTELAKREMPAADVDKPKEAPEVPLKDAESPEKRITEQQEMEQPAERKKINTTDDVIVEAATKPEPEVEPEPEGLYKKPGWQDIAMRRVELEDIPAVKVPEKPKPTVRNEEPDLPEIEALGSLPSEPDMADDVSPVDALCKDCEPVSMLYENSALQITDEVQVEDDYEEQSEEAFEMPVTENTEANPLAEYFPVDGLCKDCGLLSYLKVNPIEAIIYRREDGQEIETEMVESVRPMSILEELCAGCGLLSFIFENIKAEFYGDIGVEEEPREAGSDDSENIILAEASEDQTEDVIKPLVIEVPDREPPLVAREPGEDEVLEVRIVRDSDLDINQLAEILTPADNRTPTKEQYVTVLDRPHEEQQKPEEFAAHESGVGLPIYEQRDIEIKVFFAGLDRGLSFRVLKKGHPMEKGGVDETDITEVLEEIELAGESGLRRIFSLASAGKGVYSFTVESGAASVDGVDVQFLLHKGLSSERQKEYKGVKIAPGGRVVFKLLMPEAIFWDDDFFTGTIEGSSFITKFNDKTGLIWKEESR